VLCSIYLGVTQVSDSNPHWTLCSSCFELFQKCYATVSMSSDLAVCVQYKRTGRWEAHIW